MIQEIVTTFKGLLAAPMQGSRKCRAYALGGDGAATEVDAEAIYIQLDDKRGLLIQCRERFAGEGVAIWSHPSMAPDRTKEVMYPVLRCGGANVFFLSVEKPPGRR